jgi:AP-3 complex subunit beta
LGQSLLVKLQALTLAAKLYVSKPDTEVIGLLTRYTFSLARYDVNYDVRDRARWLSALTGTLETDVEERGGVVLRREQVRLVLFEGKNTSGIQEAEFQGHRPGAPM